MTINEAIDKLQALAKRNGNVNVYFDCPKCGESFTPDKVVALAVHLTQEPAK